MRERRGRDPPRPRAALGQGHDFAYPMYPSRHFRFVRGYHHIIFLIQHLRYQGVELWPMNAAAASIGRTETDRSLPWGRGAIRPGRGERRPRPDSGRGEGSSRPTLGREAKPPAHAALPNRIARTIWTLLAHERAYRDDCASSPAGRTVGREGEMARREVANGTTRGDGKQVGPAYHEAFGGARTAPPRVASLTSALRRAASVRSCELRSTPGLRGLPRGSPWRSARRSSEPRCEAPGGHRPRA